MTRHIFIINPVAGHGDHLDRLRGEITRAAGELGVDARIAVTEHKGHAVSLACEAALSAKGDALRLYACGGDGTLQEVVSAVAGLDADAAVTHVPCGTGNDFLRQFDPARFTDIAALLRGTVRPLDVLRLDLTAPDGAVSTQYALNIASIGIDARVTAEMRRFRGLLRFGAKMPYNLSLLYNLVMGIHRPYRVTVDGEVFDERFTLMAACNGQYYGGGFHPMPYAELDDGLLDFLLVRKVSRLQVAQLIQKYSSGRFEQMGDRAVYRRGKRMEVELSADEVVNLDGENFWGRSVAFSLADRRLGFILPQDM
jgi:YegS/Rv2252/BmrU family lipid kinase